MNGIEYAAHINALRLANKNKWYVWQGVVNGAQVQVKGFNTWLQIQRVNGVDYSGGMDISVKEFKLTLENATKESNHV